MTARRTAFVLLLLPGVVLGFREVVNGSRFQLFGDAIARLDTNERIVALTFDDGPHPAYTPRILDILDRRGAKATFFMLGRNVERHPDVVRAVLARGHEIGNHSYSHPRMIFMSPSRITDEITRTDRLLREIGVTGEIGFRPPHLSKLIVLPYVLRKMGTLSVLADADAEEWRRQPAPVMTKRLLDQVRPGSIVSLHDTAGDETIKTVDAVLAALVARGYRFETVAELVRRRR